VTFPLYKKKDNDYVAMIEMDIGISSAPDVEVIKKWFSFLEVDSGISSMRDIRHYG
jgi:hypothetical protein